MNGPSPVLLVEDDANDVALTQRAFRKGGIPHPLTVVGDGEEAIAYLAGQGRYAERALPGLVLLDLKLPRKSGLEVLAWIRSQPGLRRLPVVVLTSSKESADVNRAYDHGVNSYLVKPVDFDDLLAMVRSVSSYWLALNRGAELS